MEPPIPTPVIWYWLNCQVRPLLQQNHSLGVAGLKPSFRHSKPVFIGLYAILGLACLVLNSYFLYSATRRRVLHSFAFKYLALLSVSNLLSGTVGSSVTLLIHMTFWDYGGFLCYFMPVFQESLTYLTFLSLCFVVIDLYRQVVGQAQSPMNFPASASAIVTFSMCLALPSLIFTNFYEWKEHGLQFCHVGIEKMGGYARGIFVLSYVVPVLTMATMLIKASVEINMQEETANLPASSKITNATDNTSEPLVFDVFAVYSDHPMANIRIQKLTIRYLSWITGLTAAFWLPLNITLIVQLSFEGSDCTQLGKHDLAYAVLVWIAFLHTVATPALSCHLLKERELGLMEYMAIQFHASSNWQE